MGSHFSKKKKRSAEKKRIRKKRSAARRFGKKEGPDGKRERACPAKEDVRLFSFQGAKLARLWPPIKRKRKKTGATDRSQTDRAHDRGRGGKRESPHNRAEEHKHQRKRPHFFFFPLKKHPGLLSEKRQRDIFAVLF
nr:hypothetical protein [Pandoravirus massiliensis]